MSIVIQPTPHSGSDLQVIEPVAIYALPKDALPIDVPAIDAWVTSKRGSVHTRRAFNLEAKRWLAWLIWVKCKNGYHTYLDKATSMDASMYQEFLETPYKPIFPAEILALAGLTNQPFSEPKFDDKGDPIPMSKQTRQRAISCLKAMYDDLKGIVDNPDLRIVSNPFERHRVTSRQINSTPRNSALTQTERRYVDVALDRIKESGPKAIYHQCRWIWNALKWTALRRAELAELMVSDMRRSEDGWLLEVRGKGDKVATIPLSNEFIDEFKVYRQSRGLPLMPAYDSAGRIESTPLVLPVRRHTGSEKASDQVIYRYMKRLLTLAAEVGAEDGNPDSAARLRGFAAHSARHTCITMIVDETGDITLGQDMARHASIETTRRYKAKSLSRLTAALKQMGEKDY